MNLEELRNKVRKWDLHDAPSPDRAAYYSTILEQLDYHASREWRTYLPAERPTYNPSYMERLAAWIGNVPEEADQKLLLDYARYICFFSHDDFAALYRSAFEREVTRWVVREIGALLQPGTVSQFQNKVHAEMHRHTWYCPITDSMDINEFYKSNHLTGIGHRPTFSTLQLMADGMPTKDAVLAKNIREYMANPGVSSGHGHVKPELKRIVLLEDIVGSGTQCIDVVEWAVQNLGKPILFVPLILCPNGAESIRKMSGKFGLRLTVSPVIELQRCDLLGRERPPGTIGWPISDRIEALVQRCATEASPGMEVFGFLRTGCSIATFANTPDNTLPVVHNRPAAGTWSPLFPRVFRD